MAKIMLVSGIALCALISIMAISAPQTYSAPHPLLLTPTVTPTCPTATPEPLWVNPVISHTDLYTQTITVYIGNGEFVTVSAASGVFTAAGAFDAYAHPALVTVTLLPCLSHQLGVWGKVKTITQGECVYGGYTLYTSRDRLGKPLVITQHAPQCKSVYLPLLLKNSNGTLLLPYANTCR